MKVTAVFLSKKNSKRKKDFINNIREKNKYQKKKLKKFKLIYLIVCIVSIIVLSKSIPVSSKILYFGSNFRQADDNNIEISDIFNIYSLYNKENYIFANEIKIEKAQELDTDKDAIEIIDNITKDQKEQTVFGENRQIHVEITENSKNIQRITLNKMKILNYSSKREIDFKSLAVSSITLTKKSDKILLYNTHTSESYANSEKYQFEYSGNRRSKDANYNMLAIARKFKENLDGKGFDVVQDTTPHDYGTYTSSYSRSRITVKNALATMGSAGIIIDVHRDATSDLDYRPVVNINGVQVAQCMLVMGVGTDVTSNPHYEENLKLAFKMQQIADEMYPGLFRPMIIRDSIYNQDLNKYSLLIEVGASGNTIEEAYLATRCLSNLLNIVYKD